MRILIALDSFKGTLSALEACELAASGLRRVKPDWEVELLPMADGGEGTTDALVAACGGRVIEVGGVTGPLPDMTIDASFGWLPNSRTAVVEMARASGLPLLELQQRNPMLTTTRGTGELLQAALDRGAEQILLTLGGSATVDGGTGAARALGWRLLDTNGGEVPEGGRGLEAIRRIVPPGSGPDLVAGMKALCDVDNPLCGPRGAAAVYGPQKGASPAMVEQLEAGLLNLAACIKRDLGQDVRELPGAGAAGGFGAGAVAFFDAELAPGIEAVAEVCGLRGKLENADWVVTGEGMFDEQSLQGKVVCGVRNVASELDVPVAVLAGRVALGPDRRRTEGIAEAMAAAPPELPDEEAFANAAELLGDAAGRLADRIAAHTGSG